MSPEKILISTFVTKDRQERYIKLIQTERGRKKFKTYISHFNDFNPGFTTPLNNIHTSLQLYNLLKDANAPETCYIISDHSDYDMKSLPLLKAIQELFNSGIAYIISCIPEKLAYYENEDSNQRVLLKKETNHIYGK